MIITHATHAEFINTIKALIEHTTCTFTANGSTWRITLTGGF